jgi:nicotinamidase-related amidase
VTVKALLVIDVQNGVSSWEDTTVLGGDALLRTINSLIDSARESGSPVVLVQHRDEWLVPGSELFDLVSALDTRPDVDLSIVKEHGSAFHETPLEATLRELGVEELVVCGLQTELCVDSTVRHAIALGFAVTLVADAHSTFDSEVLTAAQIIAHHNLTLGNYASVTSAGAVSF